MLGLDAAGKTTILYKLHIGEVLSTVPTIGGLSLITRTELLIHEALLLESCYLTLILVSMHTRCLYQVVL